MLLNSYISNINQAVSSFQAIVPLGDQSATILGTIAQVLPFFLVAATIYSLYTLRPALMISLLTIFFLVLTSVLGTVDLYLSALVVASAFTSLVGFSYARAAKILQGRKPILESQGPTVFKITSRALDLILPIASALGVMALVAYIMGVIKSQVIILPQPLSSLGSLYLESHFYLVITILTVAAGAIWAMRSLLEPIILRFTLTPTDARQMAYSEVRDTYARIVWESSKKPSRGRGRFIAFTAILALVIITLIFSVGPEQSANELLAALGITRVAPSQGELLTGNIAENLTRAVDQDFVIFQNASNFIIKLLWG